MFESIKSQIFIETRAGARHGPCLFWLNLLLYNVFYCIVVMLLLTLEIGSILIVEHTEVQCSVLYLQIICIDNCQSVKGGFT